MSKEEILIAINAKIEEKKKEIEEHKKEIEEAKIKIKNLKETAEKYPDDEEAQSKAKKMIEDLEYNMMSCKFLIEEAEAEIESLKSQLLGEVDFNSKPN